MKYVIRTRIGFVKSYDKGSPVSTVRDANDARQFDSILDANNFRECCGELMYGYSIIEESRGQKATEPSGFDEIAEQQEREYYEDFKL